MIVERDDLVTLRHRVCPTRQQRHARREDFRETHDCGARACREQTIFGLAFRAAIDACRVPLTICSDLRFAAAEDRAGRKENSLRTASVRVRSDSSRRVHVYAFDALGEFAALVELRHRRADEDNVVKRQRVERHVQLGQVELDGLFAVRLRRASRRSDRDAAVPSPFPQQCCADRSITADDERARRFDGSTVTTHAERRSACGTGAAKASRCCRKNSVPIRDAAPEE